jgi:alkylation response protein AidB-like acyl-CoA dehydrogenase
MSSYLQDGILIYFEELFDWDSYFRFKKGEGVDVESERAALIGVVETAAGICSEIEPLAREGWELTPSLVDGEIVQVPHLAKAYDLLREAGLVSLGVKEKYGGFDLPALLNNVVLELAGRADASLMPIIGLQTGAAEDIQHFASEELCERYLPGFVSGELQGAMDLTEPAAGSDLGGISTRVTEEGGRLFLDGEKIFITNGGAEIHMVLARDGDTFDESKGTTRGLSLLICPRTLPDGTPNGLILERLEEKMGIHGSPTAALRFDHAEGFRIGKKGDGFKAMLELMNNARIGVAGQGIGIAQAALAESLNYSKERKQFGQPIGEQPLVKDMLTRMVLGVEGSRALLYRCCGLIDSNRAMETYLEREGDAIPDAERAELQRLMDRNTTRFRLLTPLVKYLGTETADQVTRMAIQIHGGVGYMSESVVGRLHLDGIVTTIYEGTSEIQISFALRELGRGALGTVFEELELELEQLSAEPLAEYAAKLRQGMETINGCMAPLMQDFGYALLCSRHVAEMLISVIVGVELLKQARVREQRLDLAAGWINRRMAELEAHARRVSEGKVERIARCDRIIAMAE